MFSCLKVKLKLKREVSVGPEPSPSPGTKKKKEKFRLVWDPPFPYKRNVPSQSWFMSPLPNHNIVLKSPPRSETLIS